MIGVTDAGTVFESELRVQPMKQRLVPLGTLWGAKGDFFNEMYTEGVNHLFESFIFVRGSGVTEVKVEEEVVGDDDDGLD